MALATKPALAVEATPAHQKARSADEFLSSIGVCSAVSRRGENLEKTIEIAAYLGVRWFREGYESGIPIVDFTRLHDETGVLFTYGLMSGGMDLARLLDGARELAKIGALIGFEGNNEPNNWGIRYKGKTGGRNESWVAVAELQRDLYEAVKSDPLLKDIPVWSISESGAQTDNVGLQFLTIPLGAGCSMPDGTRYADYATCHNYLAHPAWRGIHDNQTWIAADPTKACRVDGLYGNYGLTWRDHFKGYSEADVLTLPRVTTETGVTLGDGVTEEIQGKLYMSLYLDQFLRGWRYTSVYILRDRSDEGGNQSFGFYRPDYTPRTAATYLHNLTTILAEETSTRSPGSLAYSVAEQPATVHDMLLQKKDGTFELVVWNERVKGSDEVTVRPGAAAASVTIYDPTVGTSPVRELSDVVSVELSLSDHPMIIEIPDRAGRSARASSSKTPAESSAKRPTEVGVAMFDELLRARLAEATRAGEKVGFFSSSMRTKLMVISIETSGALHARAQRAGPELTIRWDKLTLGERASLAVASLRTLTDVDHAVAAFFLMASGDDQSAREHLAGAGELAAEVRASFK